MPLQIRRGTDAERLAMTQPLSQGELLYVTNDQRLYIGNGSTLGGIQITGYTNEDAQDAAAQLFANGTHTGIIFAYNDASASISAVLDLSNFAGTIRADAFKGSVFGDDSTPIVDAINNMLNGNLSGNVTGNVTGNLIGNVTGNVTGDVTGNVTGNVTGTTTGYHTGDVKGSVFGEDSSKLIDSVESLIVGDIDNSNVDTKRLNITATDINTDIGIVVNTNAGGDDNIDLFNINSYHDDSDAIGAFFSRSRGTYTAPTTLTNGDPIFKLVFAGTTSDGSIEPAAAIVGGVSDTVGAGVLPGNIQIYTATSAGAITAKLIIGPDGLQTVVAPALIAGAGSGQVNIASIASWMKVNFNGVNYAVPMYTIAP